MSVVKAEVPAATARKLEQLRAIEDATNAELLIEMIDERYAAVVERLRREGGS